jgi:hypothetical protein
MLFVLLCSNPLRDPTRAPFIDMWHQIEDAFRTRIFSSRYREKTNFLPSPILGEAILLSSGTVLAM